MSLRLAIDQAEAAFARQLIAEIQLAIIKADLAAGNPPNVRLALAIIRKSVGLSLSPRISRLAKTDAPNLAVANELMHQPAAKPRKGAGGSRLGNFYKLRQSHTAFDRRCSYRKRFFWSFSKSSCNCTVSSVCGALLARDQALVFTERIKAISDRPVSR